MTFQAAIKIYDGVSPGLRFMQTEIIAVTGSLDTMRDLCSNANNMVLFQGGQGVVDGMVMSYQAVELHIGQACEKQAKLNEEIQDGGKAAKDTASRLGEYAKAFSEMEGLKNLKGKLKKSLGSAKDWLVESMKLADVQIGVERQLYTVLGDRAAGPEMAPGMQGPAAPGAFDKIKDRAMEVQGYSIYSDETLIKGAAELAKTVGDGDAITHLMGTLADYAAGMSGGAAVDMKQMEAYAAQLRGILEGNAQALQSSGLTLTVEQQQKIAIGTDLEKAQALGEAVGQVWGGLAAGATNTFQGMGMQLANAFKSIREEVGANLMPHVKRIFDVIRENMPTIQAALTRFGEIAGIVAVALAGALKVAADIAEVVMDNWSWIEPIVWGIVGAVVAFELATKGAALAQGIFSAMTNPITWVIIAIAALIAIIIIVARRIAETSDVANSAFGVIAGWIFVVGAFFKNLGLTIANFALGCRNALGALASNMGIAFSNTISNIQGRFYNLMSTVMTVVAKIAEALNKLPFVEFDYSGLISQADAYAAKSAEAYENVQDYASVSDAFSQGFGTFETFQDGWISEAFGDGAAWGDNIADKVGGYFNSGSLEKFSYNDAVSGVAGMSEDISGIGGDTGAIRDSVEVTSEDLKYLRDLAEQEVINRFTTAEIHTNMTNYNTIHSEIDLDGSFSRLLDDVEEVMQVSTKGVHNS